MFGRKEDTKQRKKTEKGKYKILISAILACAVTVGLIKYQEQALSKYETVGVVCVKPSVKSLKEGTVINEETVKKYFSVEQRQKNTVSSNALMDMEKLIGKRTSILLQHSFQISMRSCMKYQIRLKQVLMLLIYRSLWVVFLEREIPLIFQ